MPRGRRAQGRPRPSLPAKDRGSSSSSRSLSTRSLLSLSDVPSCPSKSHGGPGISRHHSQRRRTPAHTPRSSPPTRARGRRPARKGLPGDTPCSRAARQEPRGMPATRKRLSCSGCPVAALKLPGGCVREGRAALDTGGPMPTVTAWRMPQKPRPRQAKVSSVPGAAQTLRTWRVFRRARPVSACHRMESGGALLYGTVGFARSGREPTP